MPKWWCARRLFGVILLFWFLPTQGRAYGDTQGDPDWLICCDKNCGPYRYADTDPIISPLGVLGALIHSLLHRHTFSEIPRLIDISASGNRDMISEKLQRDRKHDWPC